LKEQLESTLLVLAVGAAVAIGAKRFSVPYNVALVVIGLLLVFVDVLPPSTMDPQIILVVFLPLLVFEGALSADAVSLGRASRPILALAIPGVAISLFGTAAVATFGLELPFSAALLLGALLAITDTVSVLLAFRSVRVPHRLAAIMEGESLFNDGTALVLVSITTSILMAGSFDVSTTIRALLFAIVGGVAMGAAFGWAGAAVLRQTPDHLTAILASVVLVLATALLSEEMHASPVIAVVVAGLFVGNAAQKALAPSRTLALQGFWTTAGFVINVLLFLRVGMQLDPNMLIKEAPSILMALVALHAGRAVAVYGCFFALKVLTKEPVPRRWQHVMVFGNIKGALSMAAVLALPVGLAYRERLVAIVFGATFVTLVTQALPFRRILLWLGVTESSGTGLVETARAKLVAARRGLAELVDLLATGLVSRQSHAERRATFQRQVIRAENIMRAAEAMNHRDPVVDASLLYAQKAAVLDAANRGIVSSEAAALEVHAFDDAILRLEAHATEEATQASSGSGKKGH
jgi:CPA1 family monovalent cation:H+ antiporter